jgi:acyl transferase domain-containing protein
MAANTPIAIIGMSCRFAGDVDNPEKLWNLLAEGRSAWSEIPKDRFNIDGFHHPNFEKLNGVSIVNQPPVVSDRVLTEYQTDKRSGRSLPQRGRWPV